MSQENLHLSLSVIVVYEREGVIAKSYCSGLPSNGALRYSAARAWPPQTLCTYASTAFNLLLWLSQSPHSSPASSSRYRRRFSSTFLLATRPLRRPPWHGKHLDVQNRDGKNSCSIHTGRCPFPHPVQRSQSSQSMCHSTRTRCTTQGCTRRVDSL
jgi:hypothetical protein